MNNMWKKEQFLSSASASPGCGASKEAAESL